MRGRDRTGKDRIIEFLDNFKLRNTNGEQHTCMVFEVLGCTLLKLIIESDYKGLPLNQVRIIIKQVLQGLDYLHKSCSIIHTDLKPENVLVEMMPSEVQNMALETIERVNSGQKPTEDEVCNLPVNRILVFV